MAGEHVQNREASQGCLRAFTAFVYLPSRKDTEGLDCPLPVGAGKLASTFMGMIELGSMFPGAGYFVS